MSSTYSRRLFLCYNKGVMWKGGDTTVLVVVDDIATAEVSFSSSSIGFTIFTQLEAGAMARKRWVQV